MSATMGGCVDPSATATVCSCLFVCSLDSCHRAAQPCTVSPPFCGAMCGLSHTAADGSAPGGNLRGLVWRVPGYWLCRLANIRCVCLTAIFFLGVHPQTVGLVTHWPLLSSSAWPAPGASGSTLVLGGWWSDGGSIMAVVSWQPWLLWLLSYCSAVAGCGGDMHRDGRQQKAHHLTFNTTCSTGNLSSRQPTRPGLPSVCGPA